MSQYSLFVGNVDHEVDQKKLESAFGKFGPCTVEIRSSNSMGGRGRDSQPGGQRKRFAFIAYSDVRDAEEAKAEMSKKRLGDHEITVEWSKKSGKFEGEDNRRRRSDSRDKNRRKRSPGARRQSRSRSGSRSRRVRRSRSRSDSRSRRVRRNSRSNSHNRRTRRVSRSRSDSRNRRRRDDRRPNVHRNESPRRRREEKPINNGRVEKRDERRDVSSSPKNVQNERDQEQL